ncbi:MAG: hypothetical protein AAGI01_18800, partial [Myxococcota bacterium]
MTHAHTAFYALAIAATSTLLFSTRAAAQNEQSRPSAKTPASKLLAEADAIGSELVRIRGLTLDKPIKKGMYEREQLRETLLTKLAEEYSDSELARESRVFQRLGLLPQGFDYKATLLDLLTEQIAGFYDPDAAELYIMAGLPDSMQRPTMAHEIFHGIQDQHFPLNDLQEPFSAKTHTDFQLARSALVEGDATIVMLDFALYESGDLPQPAAASVTDMTMISAAVHNLSLNNLTALEKMMSGAPDAQQDSALNSAPALLRESLIFPYIAGMRFVFAARASNAWTDVDAIYADAPVSTEQIIHPERYFSKDMPVFLDFDLEPPEPFGKAPTYTNVMGEFQMYVWAREHLRGEIPGKPISKLDAAVAVEGWGGDKIIAFEDPRGSTLVAHMSAWDSRQEAKEFHDALIEGTTRRYAGIIQVPTPRKRSALSCYYAPTPAPHHLCIELRKNTVLYLDGLPAADPKAPLDTILRLCGSAFSSLEVVDYDTAYKRAE